VGARIQADLAVRLTNYANAAVVLRSV